MSTTLRSHLTAAGGIARRDDGRTSAGKVHNPFRDGANTESLAELIAKVTAVARQQVVVGDEPVGLEQVDQLQDLELGSGRLAHEHRLAIVMTLTESRLAAKDARANSVPRVAIAPLGAEDLHPAMEHASAERSKHPIQGADLSGISHIVDVQHHLQRHVRRPLDLRRGAGAGAGAAEPGAGLGLSPASSPRGALVSALFGRALRLGGLLV
mmetsp:Transcript_45708/g.132384  ORF Transcript_45708/g.132384 Transcript_45708/m.132384 type:complete len:211 (-) Transcript_45708:371-1003(-)